MPARTAYHTHHNPFTNSRTGTMLLQYKDATRFYRSAVSLNTHNTSQHSYATSYTTPNTHASHPGTRTPARAPNPVTAFTHAPPRRRTMRRHPLISVYVRRPNAPCLCTHPICHSRSHHIRMRVLCPDMHCHTRRCVVHPCGRGSQTCEHSKVRILKFDQMVIVGEIHVTFNCSKIMKQTMNHSKGLDLLVVKSRLSYGSSDSTLQSGFSVHRAMWFPV